LEAGWGLGSSHGFQTGQYLDALLLAQAPWLSGIASARLGAAVVIIFGNLEGGRGDHHAELIDLYQPHLYSTQVENVAMPAFDYGDMEAALPWWVEHISALLTTATDPANFRDQAGRHDSAQHYGVLLSLDRLFAVVNSLLVASRRDEFIRKTLFFEALDLLDGLTRRSGDYEVWASPRRVMKRLASLQDHLPAALQRLLLPRCRAAVDALNALRTGFFVQARHQGEVGLQLTYDGKSQTLSWDRATAQYLRLVRNGGHSFRECLADPFQRALFSSHTGDMPPELADLAFFHLLWLLCEPWQLAPGASRHRAHRKGS
jgi:hypothetical protein